MDRKLAAILAADVVGYSALMEQDEQGTFERLRAGRKELFEPEVAGHHGHIFKLMGDGLLAEFSSVMDAVECAVALQGGLAERNAAVPEDQRFQVRIGINLGEVIVEGDDRYGEGVNIAARLEQIAEPGGIYVSGKVAKEVEKKLAFAFEAMGEQRVKNIAEPVAVYRVNLHGQPRRRLLKARRLRRGRLVPAGLVLLVMVAASAALGIQGCWKSSGAAVDQASIAVLPFESLGDDPKWERIADGITEDIVTNLSQADQVLVIARHSTKVYKGKAVDVRQVGADLGVRYVLTGSLQANDGRVSIRTQLVDTATGADVWSDRYDRSDEDIFAVESDVTAKIANSLASTSGAFRRSQLKLAQHKAPNSLTAYDTYLMADAVALTPVGGVTKDGLIEGEKLFQKAIELDPHMSRAYVGLAYVYYLMGGKGFSDFHEASSKMMEAAQKAVELDPNNNLAHAALGQALNTRGEGAQALAEFNKAETLGPNDADTLMTIATSIPGLAEGESARAVQLAERAILLNPYYPDWYNYSLYVAYFYGEQFDKALKYVKLMKGAGPIERVYLAMIYGYINQPDEAKKAAAEVLKNDPGWTAEKFLTFLGGFAMERETELLAEGARKAGLAACATAAELKDNPNMIHVKSCNGERAKAASG
ncbi:adenylate/guanylate cyclase domain-containing protein [Mesorhizobium sp. ESP7-2]|uniref:adenylate/guanylate cyclase domain-containing protein n=1 Tax=Mesorhizobium sp. ESP7-2 TaxID=2876622 RepID=UPI001CCCCE2C|nr:adenylate/guanylate cyclase domain-containing protein [Mesorhizobium sp. ESP7-2]MBZ9711257.1 adenylate/guanylate cyclase domain-containing protein [Mesorhizobium sp. ESP7-2]